MRSRRSPGWVAFGMTPPGRLPVWLASLLLLVGCTSSRLAGPSEPTVVHADGGVVLVEQRKGEETHEGEEPQPAGNGFGCSTRLTGERGLGFLRWVESAI